ncbi:sensor histidine kinase [Actinoplanes sp. CA-030573]|uniref:sensor histidine kinase n=1 Tax=Actinoplanes sp. CA-030573 TaxID=3239898 RepID=UPI003D8DABCA
MGVRLRYTLLYGTMFLLSGAGLLAIVAAFGSRSTRPAPDGGAQEPAAEHIARLQRQLSANDEARTRQLLAGVVIGLLVMLLISMLLGNALAHRVLRPLRVITAATRRISADNLHSRLAVRGPDDEVKALADTIDDLLGRLEESFAAQRRFVADASHELRTPLATIRAALDVAVAKPGPVPPETVRLAGRVRGELDRVDRLLEGFLLLARAQHGAVDDRAVVHLAALVSEALPAPPRSSPAVHCDLAPEVTTRGNPVLLARLVGNLVDNAVRHNVPDGWVRITVRDSGPCASLVVESSGPVLDAAQVARLGRPFARIGADRTASGGTGLGLSIVAAVAAAHGGSVRITPLAAGGLRVAVDLPAAVAVPA